MLPELKHVVESLERLLRREPRGDDHDPYAWRPVARKPNPNPQRGAVAVAEPDE